MFVYSVKQCLHVLTWPVFLFAGWHLPQSCDADEHDAELGADTRHDLDDEGDVDDNDGQTSEDKDSYAMMIRTLEL